MPLMLVRATLTTFRQSKVELVQALTVERARLHQRDRRRAAGGERPAQRRATSLLCTVWLAVISGPGEL